MGKRGDGYGSEYHLHWYLANKPGAISDQVASSGTITGDVAWLPFPSLAGKQREFARLDFLPRAEFAEIQDEWKKHWPTRGKGQTWDAIGKAGDAWLLVEAKANHPEFSTPPTGATGDSLKLIESTLGKVKRDLGVHRFFPWTGTYYQHANRLAVLWFLRKNHLDAHQVSVYFTGDVFPDGTPCPQAREQWEELIEARRLTLGLPKHHALSAFEHDAFLPAPRAPVIDPRHRGAGGRLAR